MSALLWQDFLSAHGDHFPKEETAKCGFDVVKINEKQKRQGRTLLITSKYVYNLKRKRENPFKRRRKSSSDVLTAAVYNIQRKIKLKNIVAISISEVEKCMEFVLHCCDSYDYRFLCFNCPMCISRRFDSEDRDTIVAAIKTAHDECTEVKVGIEEGKLFELGIIERLGSLRSCVLGKRDSLKQDLNERSQRHLNLIAAVRDSESRASVLSDELEMKEFEMKLAVMGAPYVGKSNLVLRQVCCSLVSERQ